MASSQRLHRGRSLLQQGYQLPCRRVLSNEGVPTVLGRPKETERSLAELTTLPCLLSLAGSPSPSGPASPTCSYLGFQTLSRCARCDAVLPCAQDVGETPSEHVKSTSSIPSMSAVCRMPAPPTIPAPSGRCEQVTGRRLSRWIFGGGLECQFRMRCQPDSRRPGSRTPGDRSAALRCPGGLFGGQW
jgi:hypothetical protein